MASCLAEECGCVRKYKIPYTDRRYRVHGHCITRTLYYTDPVLHGPLLFVCLREEGGCVRATGRPHFCR